MKTGLASTALGKRKSPGQDAPLILHLTTSIATFPARQKNTSCESPSQQASTSKVAPIIINGVLVEHTKKRYCCTYERCGKAYTKPSRLVEHERSHTGQVRRIFCWLNISSDTATSGRLFVKHAGIPTFEKHTSTPMHVVIFRPVLGPFFVNEKIARNDFGLPSICTPTFRGTTE